MQLIPKASLRIAAASAAALIASVALLAEAIASGCISWPKVMTAPAAATAADARRVVVEPFQNFFKQPDQEWMVLGLRDYVADLLRSSRGLNVAIASSAGGAAALAPEFTISGIAQISEGRARIFVRLFDAGGKLLSQQEAAAPFPNNAEFFTRTAAAVKALMGQMKAAPDDARFAAIRDATASTDAYASFAKGRQILQTWNPEKAELARALFLETKRLDYRSPLGYEGMIALDAFMGLVLKQQGRTYTSQFQRAEAEYLAMKRSAALVTKVFDAPAPLKGKETPTKIDNRFLAGNMAFTEGIQLEEIGNYEASRAALQRAVALVPEDAKAWYALSRVEAKLNNQQGMQDALQKAYAIDSCVES